MTTCTFPHGELSTVLDGRERRNGFAPSVCIHDFSTILARAASSPLLSLLFTANLGKRIYPLRGLLR